ncbi:protein FAM163A [Labrus bergylta]|uniref:Family with sequence similarity 163 member Aa n=1 Tax=Labrus bergylta TaxID=56723 RepID=A0A3Q3GZ90_9LABR|nr:protein FAM163A [Labrus bergylta]XP_060890094.1 protein FAM163A [Labrus mixtus]XP_060890095.1 protein FAM163A [Labrus mixtus]
MTAGTVVITGGILATVILLCIIAVLCYCRLQYYCCKKNGSDSASISQQHFACNACSVSGLDGPIITPLSMSPPELPVSTSDLNKPTGGRGPYCPTCSPYDSPFYIRASDEMRNGGERITYMPTHYDNQALAMPLPAVRGTLLRDTHRGRPPDFYTNTRAITTEV